MSSVGHTTILKAKLGTANELLELSKCMVKEPRVPVFLQVTD